MQQTHKTGEISPICEWKQYVLKGSYSGSLITLHLQINNRNDQKTYQVHTDLSKYQKNLFQNAQQLFEYLSQPQNIVIDLQKSKMTVVGAHPIKRSSLVDLLTFELKQIYPSQSNSGLAQVLALCQDASYNICKESNLRYILVQLVKKVNSIVESNVSVEIQRIINKIQNVGNQLSNTQMKTADILTQTHSLCDKTDKLQQKVNKVVEQLEHNLQSRTLQTKQLLSQLMQSSNKKQQRILIDFQNHLLQIKKIKQRLSMIDEEQLPSKIKKIERIQNNKIEELVNEQIDKTAKFFKHFAIKGNNIIKQDDLIFPTMLIGAKSMREIQEFKIRICQMGILKKLYPGVCVGIVDSKHKNKQSCNTNDNVIEYSCAGKLFQANKHLITVGNGFSDLDYIHVKVDFDQGTIGWLINQELVCRHQTKIIKNRQIDWRPYVFMRDKGDSIDWILKQ